MGHGRTAFAADGNVPCQRARRPLAHYRPLCDMLSGATLDFCRGPTVASHRSVVLGDRHFRYHQQGICHAENFFVLCFVIFWLAFWVLNLLGIVDVPRLYITLPAAAATIALHRTRYNIVMILTTACALVVWVIVEFLNSLGVINTPNLVATIIAFVIGGLVYYLRRRKVS